MNHPPFNPNPSPWGPQTIHPFKPDEIHDWNYDKFLQAVNFERGMKKLQLFQLLEELFNLTNEEIERIDFDELREVIKKYTTQK